MGRGKRVHKEGNGFARRDERGCTRMQTRSLYLASGRYCRCDVLNGFVAVEAALDTNVYIENSVEPKLSCMEKTILTGKLHMARITGKSLV